LWVDSSIVRDVIRPCGLIVAGSKKKKDLPYYHRLLDRGKSKMTAVVAAMRKMLSILNAMIEKGEAWNPRLA